MCSSILIDGAAPRIRQLKIVRGIIVVVYAEKTEDLIRIISARLAIKKEIRLFREREKD